MTIAEIIADRFTETLDMEHLTRIECQILHGIKAVAIKQWAKDLLTQQKGELKQ